MEKEKVDVCSPDTFLEVYLTRLESETDSSKESSTSEFEAQKVPKHASRLAEFIQLCKIRSKRPTATLHPLSILKLSKSCSNMKEDIDAVPNPIVDTDLNCFKPHWKNFSLLELQIATNSFDHKNLIGKGGYAEVYKGCLRNGQLVAIKRLTRGTPEEMIGDFLSEVGIMAHVNHPNTAKLFGCGVEGGMHLVLELSPHGSLASLLHSN